MNLPIKTHEWQEYDLLQDGKVDRHYLDDNAEKHTDIMNKWLELLTQAQGTLSKAKRDLDFTESELFLEARRGGMSGLTKDKPTEAAIKAWIHTQPKYRKAVEERDTAENNVSYLQNAKMILEHKKSMIKIESDLWICGYFAKPFVSKHVQQIAESELREQAQEKLRESLTKRRRRDAEE